MSHYLCRKELMVAIQLEAKSNQDLTHAYDSLKKDVRENLENFFFQYLWDMYHY